MPNSRGWMVMIPLAALPWWACQPEANREAYAPAAQVEHVIYYLQILERDIAGQEVGSVDWGEIWDRVSGVTAPEWDNLQARLRAAYDQLRATLQAVDDWARDDAIGASMALCSYRSQYSRGIL